MSFLCEHFLASPLNFVLATKYPLKNWLQDLPHSKALRTIPQSLLWPPLLFGARQGHQLPSSFLLPLPVGSLPCPLSLYYFSTESFFPCSVPSQPPGDSGIHWLQREDPRLRSRQTAQCPGALEELLSVWAAVFCRFKQPSAHIHSWFEAFGWRSSHSIGTFSPYADSLLFESNFLNVHQ